MHKSSKLVNKDEAKIVGEFVSHTHPVFKEYKFKTPESVYIDLVKIMKTEDGCTIFPNENCDKEYLREWREDIGKYICRDFNRHRDDGIYFTFDMNGNTILIREYFEDEKEEIENREMNHIVCGDAFQGFHYYSIVRILKHGERLRTPRFMTDIYNTEEDETTNVMDVNELEKQEEIIETPLF